MTPPCYTQPTSRSNFSSRTSRPYRISRWIVNKLYLSIYFDSNKNAAHTRYQKFSPLERSIARRSLRYQEVYDCKVTRTPPEANGPTSWVSLPPSSSLNLKIVWLHGINTNKISLSLKKGTRSTFLRSTDQRVSRKEYDLLKFKSRKLKAKRFY